jgi:DNA polymerase elongation subunit (family B)
MPTKIKFYPLNLEYSRKGNVTAIFLYGKTLSGEKICVVDRNFRPFFYVEAKHDVDTLLDKLLTFDGVYGASLVEKNFKDRKLELVKVRIGDYSDRDSLLHEIKNWDNVKNVFEYDIDPERQYIFDKDIKSGFLTEADCDVSKIRMKVVVFEASNIVTIGDELLEEYKILALDIETYMPEGSRKIMPEKNPILMVSLFSNDTRVVITTKHYKTKLGYVVFVKSEEELLLRTFEMINKAKPDVITGYNSDRFDLMYLKRRCDKYDIDFDIPLDNHIGDMTSAFILSGILHIDTYIFVKNILAKSLDLEELGLGYVVEKLLNQQKMDVDLQRLSRAWDENAFDEFDIFCEYCLNDARLAFDLLDKIFPQIIEMAKLLEFSLDDISRMSLSSLAESFIMKNAYSESHLIPNIPSNEDIRERIMTSYKGGYVKTPKAGLYSSIAVYDFRSLYPSIMAAYNISPSTVDCKCCEGDTEFSFSGFDQTQLDNEMVQQRTWFCKNKIGLLPMIIRNLLSRRIRINGMIQNESLEKEELESLRIRGDVLKLIANSLYGYLTFANARWYSLKCAKIITGYGRYYLKKIIHDATENSLQVIYGDTDSIFIKMDSGKEKIIEFTSKINEELPEFMALEKEDFYTAGLFVEAKKHEAGAKKKYVLVDSDGRLKIRGFECTKSNYSNIARRTQRELLKIVLSQDKESARSYVEEIVRRLKNYEVDVKDLVLKVKISKPLDKYSIHAPYIEAGRRMQARGFEVGPGTIVRYVIIKGVGPLNSRVRLIEEISKDKYDCNYYVEHQILSSVEKIFEAVGVDLDVNLSRFL